MKCCFLLRFLFFLTTVSLLSVPLFAQNTNEDIVDTYLKKVSDFWTVSSGRCYDSSFYYMNKALSATTEKTPYEQLFSIYVQYANYMSRSGNYSIALEYAYKALNLTDDDAKKYKPENLPASFLKQYVTVYGILGLNYLNFENTKDALIYLNKSVEALDSLSSTDSAFVEERKYKIYINIGSAYLMNKELENASKYYSMALDNIDKNKNGIELSALYNNLGIVCRERGEYEQAYGYYLKSLEIREEQKDTLGLAQVYNNIGNNYFSQRKYREAIPILNKSLLLSRLSGGIKSEMLAAQFLSNCYEEIQDYRNAFKMQKLSQELNDSILGRERIQLATRLGLQYQYEKQLKEEEFERELKQKENERYILIAIIVIVILIFSFIVLVLYNRNQRVKMKQTETEREKLKLKSENLLLEKENLLLRNKQLELDVEFKNKEMATYVMYLVQKNEFIASLTQKLLDIKLKRNDDKTWLESIVNELRAQTDSSSWSEFELRFQQVHEDFYIRLRERFPDLTQNEEKLCAFLKLNMSTKEISSITYQSVKSIEVARTRLRKKLNLSRDENLVSFLKQL